MIEVYNQLDDLEEIWLGDVYPVEFYKDLEIKVYDALAYLTEKTKQDLDQIESKLKELGIVVRRPSFSSSSDDHRDKYGRLLKPPIAPRDDNIAIDRTFYHLRNNHAVDPWRESLDVYRNAGSQIIVSGWLDQFGYLQPPSIIRLGETILICKESHAVSWDLMERDVIPMLAQDHKIRISETGGHTDAVYAPIREGYVLGSHWMGNHDELTGWQVHKIPFRPPAIPPKWLELPNNDHRWWIEDVENPGHFHNSLNDFLYQEAEYWIGNAQETVFEVNCLVINRSLVMTTGEPDHDTRKWFKSIGVEFIAMPVRTRAFWDAGIHCLTCDIKRKRP